MSPTVAAEPVTAGTHAHNSGGPEETDYHALNAMLNLYDADGKIQFEKDVLAARQYFLEHVNQNTVFFHNQDEKLDYLIRENYYEREVLDQYSRNFVKTLLDRAYAKKFRFPTFLGEEDHRESGDCRSCRVVAGRRRASVLKGKLPFRFLKPRSCESPFVTPRSQGMRREIVGIEVKRSIKQRQRPLGILGHMRRHKG